MFAPDDVLMAHETEAYVDEKQRPILAAHPFMYARDSEFTVFSKKPGRLISQLIGRESQKRVLLTT